MRTALKFLGAVVAAVVTAGALGLAASGVLAASGEVNLYTDRQEVFLRAVLVAFEEESGVAVNVLFVKKGLLERMRAEGEESPADVVMAADVGRLRDFAAAGLTAPVDDAALLAAVPPEYRDGDGYWFGITRRARAIFTGANGGAKTYDDLASPQMKGGVCMRSGLHSYNIALISDMIARKGKDGARAWLEGVKQNLARTPQGNDRAQIRGVLNGECRAGVANSYYYFQMLKGDLRGELLANVEMVVPLRANVNVTGSALAARAPNRENALLLMRFLAGEKAQNIYASENFEFPVNLSAEYPPELERYRGVLLRASPAGNSGRYRKEASRLVEEIGFDR